MSAAYDLNEMVDLFAISRSSRRSDLMTEKIATLPLREAVALVIEDWADDKFRQLSAVIQLPSGLSIRSLDDIRHLYECTAEGGGTKRSD